MRCLCCLFLLRMEYSELVNSVKIATQFFTIGTWVIFHVSASLIRPISRKKDATRKCPQNIAMNKD